MPLFPSWRERLAGVPVHPVTDAPTFRMPRSPSFYADRTTFVDTPGGAQALVELARQRPIAWAGFDTEFRYDRPGVAVGRGETAYDPRSIRPLLLSLALAEPGRDGGRLYRFVVDLRRPDVRGVVGAVLGL